ncbi:hypothetical protein FCI23_45965 [Actinacidiphila oryziradicis]|uniref:Uncharacterized protein n=1 Tax=Actinacidiphila oryziradicis TaxID=2571141 RepID=A0A4U0RTG6_9ACTN|nr:hypothetical protein FCI23_45965 [Actinacidiphila oryziradicis]
MGRWLSERVNMPLFAAAFDGAHHNAADVIASGCATPVRTSVARYKGGLTDLATGPEVQHLCTHPPSRSSACRTAPRSNSRIRCGRPVSGRSNTSSPRTRRGNEA